MLHKLLKVHKLGRPEPPKPKPAFRVPGGEEAAAASSSALKIVHAGGAVECYFMPIPAERIVERYPSFYVTRPEVFRHPWESVVGPDETLVLGEKYYLVPRHTVKKLRRRTRRPSRDDRSADFSASRPFNGGRATGRKGGDPSGSFARRGDTSDGSVANIDCKVSKTKTSTAKKHVSVRGIDDKHRKGPPPPPPSTAAAGARKHGKVVENARKGRKKKTSQSGGEMSKVKPTATWQPVLASISEAYGYDE